MPTTPVIAQKLTQAFATATATSISGSFPGAATVGNGILVFIGWHTAGVTINSLGDANPANYYSDQSDASGSSNNLSIWWLPAIKSGSGTITITVNFSATCTNRWLMAYEIATPYYCPDPGSVSSRASPASTTPTTASILINLPNALLFSAVYPLSSPTIAAMSGWTLDASTANGQGALHTDLASTSGSYVASPCTLGSSVGSLIGSIAIMNPASWPVQKLPASRINRTTGKYLPGGIWHVRPIGDGIGNITASQGWTFPGLSGQSVRMWWNQINTANGVYDWSIPDAAVALAAQYGRPCSFAIAAQGTGLPAWLTGYQTLAMSTGTAAAPWDTIYKNAWQTFINAFGARYDSNPWVSFIVCTGPGAVPSASSTFCSTTADDTLFFNAFSGNQATAVSTWISAAQTILGFWASAFKKTPLVWLIGKTLSANYGNFTAYGPFFGVAQVAANKWGIGIKNSNYQPGAGPLAIQSPNVMDVPYYSAQGLDTGGFITIAAGSLTNANRGYLTALAAESSVYESVSADFQNFSWAPVITSYDFALRVRNRRDMGVGSI